LTITVPTKNADVVGTTKAEYDQVKVLRRSLRASGVSRGTESGVAADAGEILAVFDADASFPNLLGRCAVV